MKGTGVVLLDDKGRSLGDARGLSPCRRNGAVFGRDSGRMGSGVLVGSLFAR